MTQKIALRDLLRFISPSLSEDDAAKAEASLVNINRDLQEIARVITESPLVKNMTELAEELRAALASLPDEPFKGLELRELQERLAAYGEQRAYLYLPRNDPPASAPAEVAPVIAPTVVRGFRRDDE